MASKTKWTAAIIPRVAKLAKDGATDEDLAIALGCSRRTLNNWRDKYPEFNEALLTARMMPGEGEIQRKLDALKKHGSDWLVSLMEAGGKVTQTITEPDGSITVKETSIVAPPEWIFNKYLPNLFGAIAQEATPVVEFKVTMAKPEAEEEEPLSDDELAELND